MPTSRPVSTVRSTKMTKYSFLLCAAMVLRPSDQVDEREHPDPHRVDEVPEQPGELDHVAARLRPVGELAPERQDQDHREIADPGEDVQAVESGGDEEGG